MAAIEDLRRRLADAQAKGDTAGATATQAEINRAMGNTVKPMAIPSTGSGSAAYNAVFGGGSTQWNGSPETVGSAGGTFGIPVADPNYKPATVAAPVPVTDPLDEYKQYIQDLADAASSKSLPFEHPDLVKDDASDNEEIL